MTTKLTRAGRTGTPRLSVTARAVRAALLASTASAALAVAPSAFAQSCVETDPFEVTCTGAFTADVIDSVPLVNQVSGLVLILDDATTVNPALGVNGLTADWLGVVTVFSEAEINTTGADGIYLYGSNTATLDSYGDITTEVGALGDNAIDVTAFGDANVVIGGSVYAYNDGAVDVVTSTVTSINGNANVTVDATGDVGASAFDGNATALSVDAYLNASVTIDGALSADSAFGSATGLYASSTELGNGLHNYGSISATGYAYATGAELHAGTALYAYNDGSIEAFAYGDGAASTAIGIDGSASLGGIELVNEDTITATSDDTAIAVNFTTDNYVDIYNYGTIAAYGDLYSIAIDTSGGLSADYIYNAGTITGAIYTGAGDDYLYVTADGEWNASGYSDFGDGDDTVTNEGTITLSDADISLGGYATAAGNLFQNNGTIFVEGYNYVDVGAGAGASASMFVNDNVLDFQDGAADDVLTVYGDFGGSGSINVDVEGDAGLSDMLYIEGDVAASADQTINVDLLDLSAPIADLIPIVEVSGVSVDGNFSLGTVSWDEDNAFVTLDFDLVSDIDTTNATSDVFALAIDVTGLSDAGTLAASLPGSVQSLMNSQVGTWRQRMGVIERFNDGAVALWARVWADEGSFRPGHASVDFGPGGNFDWDQKNSGVEAGVDFSVTDEFSIGLLVGKARAEVDLAGPGVGNNDIDADTWGVYGTWISPTGFYFDASYRWMSFDVDMDSLIGDRELEGDAESFNLELGYAWTLSGGLKIEPQLQYTSTNVDEVDVLETSSGMTFVSEGGDSSRGRAGVAIYKTFGNTDSGWSWTPYAALSAVREFEGENFYVINDTLVGEVDMEGTSTLLELGFTARSGNLAVYGGLNWQDGGAIEDFFGGQLGVRYTFGGAAPAPAPVPVVAAPPAKTCADLDDDADGINNCNDRCVSAAGETVGADGCPVPAPAPEPELAPKPYRN